MVIRRVNPDIVCLQEFNRTSSKAEELDSLLSDYDRTVVMEGNRRDPVFPLALYTKYRILGKVSFDIGSYEAGRAVGMGGSAGGGRYDSDL